MAAIPTRYKGRQYRSLLEAKWAAFFDLLHWPVEYEPFECDGWIPDFIIAGAHPVLVEVKPRIDMVEREKVIVPGYETLAVSATPFADCYAERDFMGFGRLLRPEPVAWPGDVVFTRIGPCRFGFRSAFGPDRDRDHIGAAGPGERCCIWNPLTHPAAIRALWTQAANHVQWKRAA